MSRLFVAHVLFGPQEPWLWSLMKTDTISCMVAGPARTKPLESEATAQWPGESHAPSLASAAEAEPPEFFAFKECQDLIRKRLREPMLRFIPQMTGLRLHVLWHGPLDFQGLGVMPVLCPIARQRADATGRQPRRCASCLQQCWKLASRPANRGREFIGQCGITNFRACLQVGNVRPLTLVLQAKVALRSPAPRGAGQGRTTRFRARHAGEPVSLAAFNDAVALARLILHDLESTAQARMAGSRLENALRRLNNTQIEAAHLRRKLRRRLPDLPESTLLPGLGSHARKLVEAMLHYVHQHYHRPFSLGELASDMKMNASYLSALFSQTTGVTFRQYLEEVRLFKAKELLRDPRTRVGEVACATGYAGPDSFRRAFKAHEGLSPEAWRAGR
jgi:AraC-like DNA-binding protein